MFLLSHDRRFLDNVVTSTIAWEGDESPGLWREYEGGYEDWKAQQTRARGMREKAARPAPPPPAAPPPAPKRAKLSYKEQRELEALPARIEALETEQKTLADLLAGTEIYAGDAKKLAETQARYAAIDGELLSAMERWEELGSR